MIKLGRRQFLKSVSILGLAGFNSPIGSKSAFLNQFCSEPIVCIYGGEKLRRWTLSDEVADNSLSVRRGLRPVPVNSWGYFQDFLNAVRTRTVQEFRMAFQQGNDLLVIREIEAIGRGEIVQEEFRNLLEFRMRASLQTILTSENHPDKIEGLWESIRLPILKGRIIHADSGPWT